MKKSAVIFLLLNFLISNIGLAVNVHWCGGKLSSIDFYASGHSCACGKKAMKKDCCKDKTSYLKVKDDVAKTSEITFKTPTLKFAFVIVKQIEVVASREAQYSVSDFYHPPPFKFKVPIYLLDRIFLI